MNNVPLPFEIAGPNGLLMNYVSYFRKITLTFMSLIYFIIKLFLIK